MFIYLRFFGCISLLVLSPLQPVQLPHAINAQESSSRITMHRIGKLLWLDRGVDLLSQKHE